jgi:hypothetical protein
MLAEVIVSVLGDGALTPVFGDLLSQLHSEAGAVPTFSFLGGAMPGVDNSAGTLGANSKVGAGSVIDKQHDADEREYPVVRRNRGWLDDSAARLQPLLARALMQASKHAHWRVRAAAVEAASKLQQESTILSQVLKARSPDAAAVSGRADSVLHDGAVGQLLSDTIIAGLYDGNDGVRRAARTAAQTQRMAGVGIRSSSPAPQLHANAVVARLGGLVTEIARVMRQADDAAKLQPLQLLAGYLHCTEGRLASPLSLRLLRTLLQSAELAAPTGAAEVNLHGYRALELSTAMPTVGPRPLWPRRYRHFSSEQVERALCRTCQHLERARSLPPYGNDYRRAHPAPHMLLQTINSIPALARLMAHPLYSSTVVFLDGVLAAVSKGSDQADANANSHQSDFAIRQRGLVLLSYALSPPVRDGDGEVNPLDHLFLSTDML